jgi:hypothetical protein
MLKSLSELAAVERAIGLAPSTQEPAEHSATNKLGEQRWQRMLLVLAVWIIGVSGCATMTLDDAGSPLAGKETWALLPVQNLTQIPQAGERVESILETLVPQRGIETLVAYPALAPPDPRGRLLLLDDRERLERALFWARENGYVYGITGTVEEWRYRSGVEGEPAVGVSLQVLDIQTGKVLWSASGSRSGWGRDTLSGTTQVLLKAMLKRMTLTD